MDKPFICVFCGSSSGDDPAFAQAARDIGAGLGRLGLGLVFGGGDLGLMGETARAARAAGAPVQGILPGFLRDREPPLPHDETTQIVPDLFVRKRLMMDRAFGFVVLPGGLGTYDEFFEVLIAAQLGVEAKPIIVVNVKGYFDALDAMIKASVAHGFAKANVCDLYSMAADADATLRLLADQALAPSRNSL